MKNLRKLIVFMRPFLWLLVIAVILTGSLTIVGMAPPLLMRKLLNDVAREGKWGIFPLVMALLFAVPLLRSAINVANSLTLNRVSLGIIARARKRMFEHLMRLSMKFYNEMPVGSINQRLMGDVGNISGVATGGIITLLTDVIAVVFAVVVMLSLSWQLSLLTFALLPLYFLNTKFFSKRIQQTNVQLRSHMDHISSANQIVQVGVAIDRISEILDREPAIKEHPDATPIEELVGDISVEGLTYRYEAGSPALKSIQLDIPAGTHLAVVGPAGAGRTTLAMLLRRFYEPEEGKIEVDGKDIREYRLPDYRRAISLVLPESAIFDGTIRENLCYGNPDASEELMIEVAKAVGLDDFLSGLAKGYETRLGTGGLKLSAGARQRIGVARALISKPFILIVDEAVASLDPESAETVNEAIRQAMEGRTCIMIVHRVLMARDADQVVVIDQGEVVETGGHGELIVEPNSLYREIYGKQYGEHRLPPTREEGEK